MILGFTSCKTPTAIITGDLRAMSAKRLIDNIEENAFDYKGLQIKRISCQYEDGDEKTTFRANLQSAKDEYIFLTLSKLNVPVGRLLLTPDSVKMINYLQKNYFIEDYNFLEDFVSADIDFYTVQSILTSDVFSYRDDDEVETDFKEFVSYTYSGMYVLQSMKNRKLNKILEGGNDGKMDRFLKKMDDDALIVQYLYIDPSNFKIRKIILDDLTNKRKVNVDFDEYELVDNQLYPGNIDIHFTSETSNLRLKVELNNFSTEYSSEYNFRIPEKYERTY